jgi:hypothetical protein
MSKSRKKENYKAFWAAFASEADELHHLAFNGHFQFVYKRLKQLQGKHKTLFCTEITSLHQELVLIFTPECDPQAASDIDSFLSMSPIITGWQFHGRRLPKPYQDVFAILEQVYFVDARDATFHVSANSGSYDICMFTLAAAKVVEQDREEFVKFFLSHSIGEQLTMAKIKNVDLLLPALGIPTITPSELVETIK